MFYNGIRVLSFLMLSRLLVQADIKMYPFTNPVNILETTTQETDIARVVCDNPGDVCICNLFNKGSDPFDVWKKGHNPDFRVFYVGAARGGKLDYQIKSTYFLTVTCYNSSLGDQQYRDLEVDVIGNQPPVFSHRTATATVKVPANSGDHVYQVDATDYENDPITYSIKSTRPTVNYFNIDQKTGEIIISTTSQLYTATESRVDVTVEVSDSHTSVDDFVLTVTLQDVNQRPVIANLPATVRLWENAAVGFTIINLIIDDPAPPFPQAPPVCTVLPSNEGYKFSFLPAGGTTYVIKLASTLDFETTSFYTISCDVTDGYLTSQNEVLTINVGDVNEPPQFDAIAYYCNLEESDAGVSSCNLGLHDIVSDPEGDVISVMAFLNGNNSNRFRYDRGTTRVTFNVDYDVDNGMPAIVTLQLQATDKRGESSQVPVYIKISDANDNTCTFPSAIIQLDKIDQGTPLGILGKMFASDDDLTSPNNLVTFEMLRAFPPQSLNFISAYSDGTVAYTALIPESSSPVSYSLVVRCKDGGTPRRSSEATVVVTYMPTTSTSTTITTTTTTTTTTTATTPTTTTSDEYDIWDESAFIGVFVTLMCFAALALLALLYLCAKYILPCGATSLGKGRGFQEFCCPSQKPKRVTPENDFTVSRVRTNPDYKDDYWRRGDKFETGKDDIPPNPFERPPLQHTKPPSATSFETGKDDIPPNPFERPPLQHNKPPSAKSFVF